MKVWLPLLAFSILAIFGCNNNTSTEQKKETKTVSDSLRYIKKPDAAVYQSGWPKTNVLVYHVISDPDDMHPTNGRSQQRTEMNCYTQMSLVSLDPRMLDLCPTLVKAMPSISSDQLRFTYELRDEPKWDDGNKLSVEDVIFTFRANKCPLVDNPDHKSYIENLKDIVVDASNPRKFTLIMKQKYIQNISFLPDFPVLERAFFDSANVLSKYKMEQFDDTTFDAKKQKDLAKWANDFNSAKYGHDIKYLNGLGMYKISEWKNGQSVTLTRKENHWTKGSKEYMEASNPDKIIFTVNKDMNSQILAFKSQELDATSSISTKTLMELEKDSSFRANYNYDYVTSYNYSYFALNCRPDGKKHKKLFVDKNVRRAMALLVPMDDLNQAMNRGKNKRITSPVSPLKDEYNTNLTLIPLDVEKAKKILDEAGWKDTDGDNIRDKMIDGEKVQFVFNLNFPNSQPEWKDAATLTAESMWKAGIKVNLNPLAGGAVYGAARNHDFDMFMGSWTSGATADDFTQIWRSTEWSSEGSNYVGFGNAASDALVDSIKYTLEPDKYIPMVKRLQEIIYEEQPYIFAFASLKRVVVHKRFGNLEIYFDRPGVLLNTLRLISPPPSSSAK